MVNFRVDQLAVEAATSFLFSWIDDVAHDDLACTELVVWIKNDGMPACRKFTTKLGQ